MYAADRGYHSYWASSWRMPLSDGDIDPDKNGSGFFGCPITTDPLAISPHARHAQVEESYDFNHQYDLPGLGRSGPDPQLK